MSRVLGCTADFKRGACRVVKGLNRSAGYIYGCNGDCAPLDIALSIVGNEGEIFRCRLSEVRCEVKFERVVCRGSRGSSG